MIIDPLPGEEEQASTEEKSDGTDWRPWPTRRNQLLAAGLASVAFVVLITAVTLVMLIHYDSNLLSSFVADL